MTETKINLVKNIPNTESKEVVAFRKNPHLNLSFNPVEPSHTKAVVATREDYKKLNPKQTAKKLEVLANDLKVRKDGMLNFIDHNLTALVDDKIPHKANKSMFAVKSQFTAFIATSLTAVSVGFTVLQSNLAFLVPVMFTTMLAAHNYDRRANLAESKKVIRPKIIAWLSSSYSIKITNDTADTIVNNMLRFTTTTFKDATGSVYRLTGRGDVWFVENHHIKGSGDEYERVKPNVVTYEPQTAVQESLLVKWELLRRQKLSTEDLYAVNRAKEEAYDMLQSAAVLTTIGDGSHERNMEEAFAALDTEMESILNRRAHEEQAKIAANRQFIVERNRKPEPSLEPLRLEK